MLRRSLISAALASALAIGLTTPAVAQTEIQWWHSMGGNLGEWVNDLGQGIQREPEGIQGRPGIQGQL